MPTIYIDNEPYTVEDGGRNLLEVCLSLGFNLPYFCWHPAMHSVGACRQCAVKQFKDENDTRGRLVMSCMTPVKDGMRISIDDPEAVAFRAGIIEWLMLNHPHDCPVCDEGGECHLQDMTLLTGHVYRRNRFKKRTYRNQNLGPLVNHELNRCIQCYRCVRYYRDYAGGRDFDVFAWHDHVYFGRYEDGVLESPFSGNLVEVCPTGVFTDKTYDRHYTRKWDLQTAPSVCVHCGLGCNIIPGERYGTLRRIRNRFNYEVNGYFLCDRGRYGYEFVNDEKRLRQPLVRMGGELQPVAWAEVKERIAGLLHAGKVIGIGSPRASLEANFTLRALVGPEHFYHGIPAHQQQLLQRLLDIVQQGSLHIASQRDAAQADAVFILGEDVVNTAPMLAMQLRQAAVRGLSEELIAELKIPPFDDYAVRRATQNLTGPFYVATPADTALDGLATLVCRAAPDDLARLAAAITHDLDETAPRVAGLSDDDRALAKEIAAGLRTAKRPLIVVGCSQGSEALLQVAANLAHALPAYVSLVVPECNSLGLAMLGGRTVDDALAVVRASEAETVIVLENDLYARLDAGVADELLAAKHVIVLDSLRNDTVARAEIALPAAAFAEADGTLVNHEGRAQRFFQVFVPAGEVMESWRWLGEMHAAAKAETTPWPNLDAVIAALAAELPAFAKVPEAAPGADFRIANKPIARQPHRYSGRTAITANITVHEPQPPVDLDAPFTFSMEGYQGQPPAPLVPRFWAPGWNSVQSVNKFQREVGGPLTGGPAGVRLLEPREEPADYFTAIPESFTPRKGEWLLLTAYHVFGSEELSVIAPGIAELMPAPYLVIGEETAAQLGIAEGEMVRVIVSRRGYSLPARVQPLPAGVAMLPIGLPGLRGIVLPAWGTLTKGGTP